MEGAVLSSVFGPKGPAKKCILETFVFQSDYLRASFQESFHVISELFRGLGELSFDALRPLGKANYRPAQISPCHTRQRPDLSAMADIFRNTGHRYGTVVARSPVNEWFTYLHRS